MPEIFVLKKPININGNEVKELPYDFDSMTAADMRAAGKAYKKDGGIMQVTELDSDYHLFVFAKAVEKAGEGIDMTDITMRLSGRDAAKAASLVRDFFFTPSEE